MHKKNLLFIPLFLTVISCSFPFLAETAAAPTSAPVETLAQPTGTVQAVLTPVASQTTALIEEQFPPAAIFSERQILEEKADPHYRIEVAYPYLEAVPRADVFNNEIEEYLNTELDQFRNDIDQLEGEWRQVESFLEVDAIVSYQSDELFSVLFRNSYLVAGAAHPVQDAHSFNYDMLQGRFLDLPALFIPGSDYLEIIAGYCEDDLDQQGLPVWPEGIQPVPANFETWNIQPESLLITFPPYQVAPGAAGMLQVSIPLEILHEVILPDGLLAPLLD